MTSSRLVRGTKGRLFACLGVLIIFATIIFLYHSTRVELDEVHNSLSKCRQEQDSLAAQVQVISEYKKTLEKSLNQEKAEHRQTKEELQSRMTDEQQLRNKENLENVNKYKALQQQYKLLQSEHEDLNELCNKVRAEQATCTEALSHMQVELAGFHLNQTAKESEISNLKLKYLRLEEENRMLFQKVNALQSTVGQGQEEAEKLHAKAIKHSSTKEIDTADFIHGADSGLGNEPHNVLHAAQKSSTVPQNEKLQPKRPAQPGLSQSVISKKYGNQSATPQANSDALASRDKASPRVVPALPLPFMLLPDQQHASIEKNYFANNGPQGVLPAPLGFGSDNQFGQHNAVPLQAPYRLHGLGHQDIPQNQGQMPPLAPMAPVGIQSNVLPAPPDHMDDMAQNLQNFHLNNHQNMNPFRNDLNAKNNGFIGHQYSRENHREETLHKVNPNNNLFNVNSHLSRNQESANDNKHMFVIQGNQIEKAENVASFLKSPMKNVNVVPLDGDINQHLDVGGGRGGNPFVELGHQNQDVAHGKSHAQPAGHQGHYYPGGDYDKEEMPANNDAEDEDFDYNMEPNQAKPPHQAHAALQAPKQVHSILSDHNHDGVMVHPR